jgi:hypothetical protein
MAETEWKVWKKLDRVKSPSYHSGCVGNEDHWRARGNGVHVRNRHTFIPPLCKEKGAGLLNVSE